jgi:CRISPR-associated protein Csb2
VIDHLLFYVSGGIPEKALSALGKLSRLWISNGGPPRHDEEDRGRNEWRVVVEGIGTPAEFTHSELLRPSNEWVSATPYLRPWHLKGKDVNASTFEMVSRECKLRGLKLAQASLDAGGRTVDVGSGARRRNTLQFHRFRSRHGLVQPDRTGTSLRLVFEAPVTGPIALGFGCHFGLGLFRGT